MDVKVLNYDYYNNYSEDPEYNGPILIMDCKDKHLNQHIVRVCDQEFLRPEFYIPAEELKTAKDIARLLDLRISDSPDSVWEEKTKRVESTFPWHVKQMRKKFTHTYQADVKWEKVAVQKLQLTTPYIEIPDNYKWVWPKAKDIKEIPLDRHFPVDIRICYWDIETDTRNIEPVFGGWKDAEVCPIINIGVFDNYPKEYHSFMWDTKYKKNYSYLWGYKYKDNIKYPIYYRNYVSEVDMLKDFFEFFGDRKFNTAFGFNSEGGYRIQSYKGSSRKKWSDGFDMPYLYTRAKKLSLLKEMQVMSPVPNTMEFGHYYGVYMRYGQKNQVVIRCLAQLDFIPIEAVFKYEDKFFKFKGYGLNDYMDFFLGYGKIPHKEKLWDLWENNPQKLRRYNLRDVEGLYFLDKKFGMINDVFSLAEIVVAPTEDALVGSKLHDHDMLREYRNKVVFDTKYQKDFKREDKHGKEQIGERFVLTLENLKDPNTGFVPKSLINLKKRGGYVAKPVGKGIHEDIGTLDFSKFYPNAIMSANAGIRTAIDLDKEGWFCVIDKEGRVWDRKHIIETPCAYFRKDIESINKNKFKKWISKREELQKITDDYLAKSKDTNSDIWKVIYARQYSLKPFTNLGFGVFGLRIDRNYSILAFNSCTLMCRDIILLVISLCEKLGLKIVGADTDSVLIVMKTKTLSEQINELSGYAKFINVKVSDYLDKVYNIQEHNIKIKPESIADKLFVHEKKHYVKRIVWQNDVVLEKPELDIKGLTLRKRNNSFFGQDLQLALLDVLMEEKGVIEGFKRVVVDFDKKFTTDLWSYLCPRGAINKKLEDYPETNQARRGAENARNLLGKNYLPGDNPFIGIFRGFGPISFEKEDEEDMKKLKCKDEYKHVKNKFELNKAILRESQGNKKADPFLSLVGLNYYQILGENKMRGFMRF